MPNRDTMTVGRPWSEERQKSRPDVEAELQDAGVELYRARYTSATARRGVW
jgi:hypothetical protein